MTKSNEEYDLEIVYDGICLSEVESEMTTIEVKISELNKRVEVKVPNGIHEGDKIRLKGMGKAKPDGTKGDTYIKFQNIKRPIYINEKEAADEVINKHQRKYEYKVVDGLTDVELEGIMNNYGDNGWKCISVQSLRDPFSSTQDYNVYDYTLIFEREY